MHRRSVFVIALGLCLSLNACDESPQGGASSGDPVAAAPPTEPVNLFANGDFESGSQPWFSLSSNVWGPPFELSTKFAASGTHSARLIASSREYPDKKTHICGVVQEITADTFPRTLRGKYYVNLWEKGSRDLYIQYVVIAFGSDNPPPGLEQVTNFQIRCPLAGISQPPFAIGNAKWIFVGTAEPKVGQWVTFEHDIRKDFLRNWGRLPRGFTKLRVLFEARWDNRLPTDPPSTAEVFYDDLYIGE